MLEATTHAQRPSDGSRPFCHHSASSPLRCTSRWWPRHKGTVNSSLTFRPRARRLRKSQVMRVGRASPADEARLLGDEPEMRLVANATWLLKRECALVDGLGAGRPTCFGGSACQDGDLIGTVGSMFYETRQLSLQMRLPRAGHRTPSDCSWRRVSGEPMLPRRRAEAMVLSSASICSHSAAEALASSMDLRRTEPVFGPAVPPALSSGCFARPFSRPFPWLDDGGPCSRMSGGVGTSRSGHQDHPHRRCPPG